MKTLFSETISLTNFLTGDTRIEDNRLTKQAAKFQINGNTILHLYALDYAALTTILDFLEENKKEYLNAILMKNFEGVSPLDITIDNDSPKNTDLLLVALSKLNEANYSMQLFTKFPKLLQMELTSFHKYLGSCVFQTVQMRNTQFLSLKEDRDVLIVSHHSCILDRDFIEKYTTLGNSNREIRERQKEILEMERKFALEQRKRAQAEKKKKEAARKKREASRK